MTGPGFSSSETTTDRQLPGVGLDEAQVRLRDYFVGFMDRALEWHQADPNTRGAPPHSAAQSTTGGGKSEEFRQAAVTRYIPEAKRLKLKRRLRRVLMAVPTHKLADEARMKMPAGATVAIWQGIKATKLGTNEPMCLNPAAVDAALAVGAVIEMTACRRGRRGKAPILCPFYDKCHFQAQKKAARKADIVLMAHEGMFQVPQGIGAGFGLVFIDEAFWQKGLTGTRDDESAVRLAIAGLATELEQFPVRRWVTDHGKKRRRGKKKRQFKSVVDDQRTHELRHLMIERLQQALAAMPDGYVRRAPLIKAKLWPYHDPINPGACGKARKYEWARKVDHGIRPGAGKRKLKKAVKNFAFLAQLTRRVEMWGALGDLINNGGKATGRLWIETVTTAEGSVRYLCLRGRKAIKEEIADLPLIHADATLQLGLSQYYLPNLRLELDLAIAAPHQRIVQVIGLPVGKSSLQALPDDKRTAAEEKRVANKRKRLVDTVRHVTGGRRGVVITYKGIEDDFKGIDGIEVGHHGAIEGIDRWKDVEVAVIIGRPLPSPKAIERTAAAITGKPVIVKKEDSIKQDRAIRLTSGAEHILTCRVYDGITEAIREAVAEAGVEQAAGRPRAVRRTAADPVEVYLILNDTVVGELPVDYVIEFKDLEPNAVDKMADRGLVPQLPVDAAMLHPDLFPSPGAAKKAYQRNGLALGRDNAEGQPGGKSSGGHSLIIGLSIRECPPLDFPQQPLCVARYQPRGARRGARLVWFDPVKVPDLQARLEKALGGELALFEVLGEPELAIAPAHPDRRLPQWRIRRLAEAYTGWAEEQCEATGEVDHKALEARVRAALVLEGFAPLAVEEELARVLDLVFAVPGWVAMDDWIMTDLCAPPCWALIEVGVAA